jgi:hypothetical protein
MRVIICNAKLPDPKGNMSARPVTTPVPITTVNHAHVRWLGVGQRSNIKTRRHRLTECTASSSFEVVRSSQLLEGDPLAAPERVERLARSGKGKSVLQILIVTRKACVLFLEPYFWMIICCVCTSREHAILVFEIHTCTAT